MFDLGVIPGQGFNRQFSNARQRLPRATKENARKREFFLGLVKDILKNRLKNSFQTILT
jgi:hypothetical protein